jgi:4-amino-4-deoxy-L-arabinose transferase-like glycosyltransferase
VPTPLRPQTPPVAWNYRFLALGLILAAAAVHVAYLACRCPLDLAPDEAHYWEWSRHLDFSYYSKGPLVAYLIRSGCELFGGWSQQLTGSLMLAVRMPAVVCGALLLLSLYVLTVQVFQSDTLAFGVVAAALTHPVLTAGSLLMTIDAPYTCCWGWALVLCHRAIFRGSTWAWLAAGLVVGVGILAKYTMIVFVPSVALYLLATPAHRQLLFRPGFWIMAAVGALCCLPIVVWNVQHDWISFRHVSALSGAAQTLHWFGPVNYVGGQFALLLGIWFVLWLCAMGAHQPLREADAGVRYLWWLSAPMFLFFLGFSLKTGGGELNWPVTAYLSGLVLTGGWLTGLLRSPYALLRRLALGSVGLACGVGLFVTVFMHYTTWLHPALTLLTGPSTPTNYMPMRRVDPTCRLRGWRDVTAFVDRLRRELTAEEGREPILAGVCWWLPGELGFYCEGHPQAYTLGAALNDRHNQYDLWYGPTSQPQDFLGRTFIVVNALHPEELEPGFEQVGPTYRVEHRADGQPLAVWAVTVCRGYRGFPVLNGARPH